MINLNRVAFTIFGVDVYYYGLIIAFALFACIISSIILCKVKKISLSTPLEVFLAIIPAGFLFARLFSVIFEDGLTIVDFFNFRTGGMSIIGAIIGGAIGIVVYKLITKQKYLHIADIVTSVLFLGQSIGRWGNYFNDEIYGQEVVNEAMQVFPISVQINGTWYEALFFWESMLTLIGFIALVIVFVKTKKTGLVTGIYFTYYGIVRLILESRRQAEYILKWGNVPVSSLLSALFIVVGLAIIIYLIVSSKKTKKEKIVGREEVHQS